MFKEKDRVKIVNDWIDPKDLRKAMGTIEEIQIRGQLQYAVIRWVGKAADTFPEKYGTLFPVDELKKV